MSVLPAQMIIVHPAGNLSLLCKPTVYSHINSIFILSVFWKSLTGGLCQTEVKVKSFPMKFLGLNACYISNPFQLLPQLQDFKVQCRFEERLREILRFCE